MALLSYTYPSALSKLENWVWVLPNNKSLPHLPGWEGMCTSGDSNGQVSFVSESDRTLVAIDVLPTVEQESLYKETTQKEQAN